MTFSGVIILLPFPSLLEYPSPRSQMPTTSKVRPHLHHLHVIQPNSIDQFPENCHQHQIHSPMPTEDSSTPAYTHFKISSSFSSIYDSPSYVDRAFITDQLKSPSTLFIIFPGPGVSRTGRDYLIILSQLFISSFSRFEL
ncbi:hypothetical protein B9Z55_029057 [Caenorhabditis nigoni]|uniref:Uncharacterized protein n=1 Tax=Caenorhabditis nigoni TaxID=1611254 RepID=A0A2G5S9B3_9PELO|nr:hypothetical protein B9Z55_029057 [Caenorhabditis nigoni]